MVNFKIQRIVGDIVGEDYNESQYFEAQLCRYYSGHGGWPRVPTFVPLNDDFASPGHSMVPSMKLKVGKLTCHQYLELMGKYHML